MNTIGEIGWEALLSLENINHLKNEEQLQNFGYYHNFEVMEYRNTVITAECLRICHESWKKFKQSLKYWNISVCLSLEDFEILFPKGTTIHNWRDPTLFCMLCNMIEYETEKRFQKELIFKQANEKRRLEDLCLVERERMRKIDEENERITNEKKSLQLQIWGCSGHTCDGVCLNLDCFGQKTNLQNNADSLEKFAIFWEKRKLPFVPVCVFIIFCAAHIMYFFKRKGQIGN